MQAGILKKVCSMRRCTQGYLFFAYTATLIVSLWLGYELRFDFSVPPEVRRTFFPSLAWILGLKLLFLWRSRQFAAMPCFISTSDFSTLFRILLGAGLIAFGAASQLGWNLAPPRGVIVTDFSLSLIGLTSVRVALCSLCARANVKKRRAQPGRVRRTGIIGAGLVGSALAQEFANRPELGLQAVAFFDDDRTKWGTRVHDIAVVGAPELLEDDAPGG